MEQFIEKFHNLSNGQIEFLLLAICLMLFMQIVSYFMLYYYVKRLEDIKKLLLDLRGYIYMHTIKGGFCDTESPKESNASQESYGQYTKFDSPGEIFNGDSLLIQKVLPDGNCVCFIRTHEDGKLVDQRKAFMFAKKNNKYSYSDSQKVEIPHGAVIFQIGNIHLDSSKIYSPVVSLFEGKETIPVISIFGMDNDASNKKSINNQKKIDL